MGKIKKKFRAASAGIAFDRKHRRTISFNMSKYDAAVLRGRGRYEDLQLARHQASAKKKQVLDNIVGYLEQFEANFTRNGGVVLWAQDSAEAVQHISRIIRESGAKTIVKSKSMTTEEIDFNEEVEKIGAVSIETDLGEYIVQLAGEKPYHIVTPAMHKSKDDVAKLFNEKFGFPLDSTAEQMTMLARKNLRDLFTSADIGVTGANFILPDVGGIALTENEGNAIMSMAFPRIHIAVAGIEKLLPSADDLALFWPHLSSHGTGQAVTVYNSIITGPRKADEPNGPEQMYVILLDNGRTKLFADEEQRVALSCIRCGACLNACPVYRNIGGYTYATTYQGPIGSVITPHLMNLKDYGHLSSACSLCGRCTENCPVKIPLHDLLLNNRRKSVEQHPSMTESVGMAGFSRIMSSRKLLDFMPGRMKNLFLQMFMAPAWGKKRALPDIAPQSFAQQWKKSHK